MRTPDDACCELVGWTIGRKNHADGIITAMASSANPISVLCIIGSCISLQLGSALAVKLFDDGGTWGTSAVRLLVAAVVLLAITRPRVHEWNRQQWAGVLGLGLSLGLMNGFFYAGIDLVPLGPAVTIEFLGPLLLAAFLSRSLRDGICVILAMTGMALLGLDAFNGNPLNPLGVAFLLGAALFWAIYILANKNAGALVPGQGGLAVAFVVGGVAMLPMGAGGAWNLVSSTDTVWFAIGTGILGSLVPYSLELIALRGLAPNVFSILISLEPVFAAFFGWLLLAQNISTLKLVAIGVVIAASVVQTVGTGGSGANGAPRSKLKKLQDVGRKVVPRRRQ